MLEALADWWLAEFLRRSVIAYPLANAAHIFSLGLLIGAIATLDLRLLGLFRSYPVAALGPPLSRVAAAGVAFAVGSGFLLFTVQPDNYIDNPAFLVKLALVLLGIVNALLLHRLPHWSRALAGEPVAPALKVSAVFSLLLWTGAVLAGRWIAFV